MTSNWVFSYAAGFTYKLSYKYYQVTESNGFRFFYKIDANNDSYLVSTPSGVWNIDDFEFRVLYENVRTNDYINIIYDVTNKGTKIHNLGVSSYVGIYIDGQSNQTVIKALKGIRGIEGFYNDHSVKVILRGTKEVTDVDTIYYRKIAEYSDFVEVERNRWINRSSYDEKPAGIKSWISFSWQNRNFKPNENKRFSFLIGRGKYISEYHYSLKNRISCHLILILADLIEIIDT